MMKKYEAKLFDLHCQVTELERLINKYEKLKEKHSHIIAYLTHLPETTQVYASDIRPLLKKPNIMAAGELLRALQSIYPDRISKICATTNGGPGYIFSAHIEED